ATHLNVLGLPRAFEMDEEVKMLAELLVGRGGRSVLIVGDSGVGKSAVTYELVNQRRKHHLGSTSFWETTGARLMVGADSFGDWQDRCRKVVAEASSSRAVMLFGNLFELAEVARHSTTPEGMAGFFRPYLDRGDLLAVVECTPKQREILERDHPHLLKSFAILELKKPSPEKVVSILKAVTGGKISEGAVLTTERLHSRYAAYSAYPGRPLRFLRELQEEAGNGITPSTVAQAFAEETGMPVFMIDDDVPLELTQTEEHFRSRIKGQTEAVSLVVDLLASVKAALSPPGKPIASLLFIGPTGVGKTEMARTLCGFLFRDRRRMVRFDMSEFSDPDSVERLVGGQEGGQGLLTSKVREQPFGLVLFDELEKADPAFFDLLLQILGEGRLTDEGGRVADFTNSVVVMTSNLGAASFSKGPLGFRSKEDKDHARQTFTSAVKAAFRPELFNRIDRLVPFAPLDLEIAEQVTEREIERMKLRDGLSSDWLHFEIGPDVASHLARCGYDRRYGARPLKRALEKQLLEPLAPLLGVAGETDLKVRVELADDKLVWTQERSQEQRANRTSVHLAREAMRARRKLQRIDDGRLAHELRNRIHRLTRVEQRKARTGHLPEDLEAQLATLPLRRTLAKELKETAKRGLALETEAVLALRGFRPADPALAAKLDQQAKDLDDLIRSLYISRFDQPDQATVIVYAEKSADLRPLVQAYSDFWEDQDF
ncbi:MAG: AAA family ATPase, partial [Candidatus Eremiobacteraeota bacterium]|nr:AAA family ATPase [Candidatus Eremiobacteraeota bacterium]